MKRTPPKPVKLSPDQIAAIETTVFELAQANLPAEFYLLAVELDKEAGYWYLRIYVEGQDAPVSLNDCERISRMLDPLVEGLNLLEDLPYSLEISSPGLFRPLKTCREFAFYTGKPVRIESGAAKTSPRNRPPAREGVLQAYDETRRVVTIRGTDGQTADLALDGDTVVYLNPEVHFPDEEDEL